MITIPSGRVRYPSSLFAADGQPPPALGGEPQSSLALTPAAAMPVCMTCG
ncbi:hypothetical protein [Streptoalloteichus tenebrarius]|nr:hypothetical protein [Streptoalloteichus tenebrarius]